MRAVFFGALSEKLVLEKGMDLAKEKFDIIIQGGQSNAEGYGKGQVEKEIAPSKNRFYLQAEMETFTDEVNLHIAFTEKPFIVSEANELRANGELVGDFSLTFCEEYERLGLLENGRKLLIVRAAVGGSGFKKGHWGLGNVLHKNMTRLVDYALSLNPENRVVGFLWHQGEHDAFEKNDPEVYRKQLTEMIGDVRSRYGYIPFIAGDFVKEWKTKNSDFCNPIIAAIKRVVRESGRAAFVEAGDLLSNNQAIANGDDIHFSRQSLHELGRRYFYAFRALCE